MTSPRTATQGAEQLRRVHEGALRQKAMYVICEWGCGEFVQFGRGEALPRERAVHQAVAAVPARLQRSCSRRRSGSSAARVATRDVRRKAATAAGGGAPSPTRSPRAMEPEVEAAQADKRRRGRTLGPAMGVEERRARDWPTAFARPELDVPAVPRAEGLRPAAHAGRRRCGEYLRRRAARAAQEQAVREGPRPPTTAGLDAGSVRRRRARKMLQCEEERLEHEQEICPRAARALHVEEVHRERPGARPRATARTTSSRRGSGPTSRPGVHRVTNRRRGAPAQGAGVGRGRRQPGHLRGQSNSQGFGGGGAFVEMC